jgi:hypothetical protein
MEDVSAQSRTESKSTSRQDLTKKWDMKPFSPIGIAGTRHRDASAGAAGTQHGSDGIARLFSGAWAGRDAACGLPTERTTLSVSEILSGGEIGCWTSLYNRTACDAGFERGAATCLSHTQMARATKPELPTS